MIAQRITKLLIGDGSGLQIIDRNRAHIFVDTHRNKVANIRRAAMRRLGSLIMKNTTCPDSLPKT